MISTCTGGGGAVTHSHTQTYTWLQTPHSPWPQADNHYQINYNMTTDRTHPYSSHITPVFLKSLVSLSIYQALNFCFKLWNWLHEDNIPVWVLTVDNLDVKRYTSSEAICEFTPLWVRSFLWYKWIQKPLKGVLRRKNINPNGSVHCCVIGCHGNSLLYLFWTKKSVVRDL